MPTVAKTEQEIRCNFISPQSAVSQAEDSPTLVHDLQKYRILRPADERYLQWWDLKYPTWSFSPCLNLCLGKKKLTLKKSQFIWCPFLYHWASGHSYHLRPALCPLWFATFTLVFLQSHRTLHVRFLLSLLLTGYTSQLDYMSYKHISHNWRIMHAGLWIIKYLPGLLNYSQISDFYNIK